MTTASKMPDALKLRLAEPARRVVHRARSVARAGRRLSRRMRRRVHGVRLTASLVAARLTRTPVYLLLSGSEQLPLPMARRLRSGVGKWAGVQVIVLDFAPQADAKKAKAQIPEQLGVRRFWLDAAPGGGGCAPRHTTEDLVRLPVPGPNETWRTGYYRDGFPVLGVTENRAASMVDHYEAGLPAWREELDSSGRLIRIVDLHPGTQEEVSHRYLDSAGECWLSVWVEADGTLGRTQRHRGTVREFPTYREAQADWVVELMADATRSRILVSGSAASEVAELTRRVS